MQNGSEMIIKNNVPREFTCIKVILIPTLSNRIYKICNCWECNYPMTPMSVHSLIGSSVSPSSGLHSDRIFIANSFHCMSSILTFKILSHWIIQNLTFKILSHWIIHNYNYAYEIYPRSLPRHFSFLYLSIYVSIYSWSTSVYPLNGRVPLPRCPTLFQVFKRASD